MTLEKLATLRSDVIAAHGRAKARYDKAAATLAAAAAINPVDAMIRHGADACRHQAYYVCLNDAFLSATHHSEDDRYTMVDELKSQGRGLREQLLKQHCWKPNSTCPWTNLTSLEEARGMSDALLFLELVLDKAEN